MSLFVIDTNVVVVANGRDDNASLKCRSDVIDRLFSILQRDSILVDEAGEMMDEYRRYCSPSGEPGLGDRFFREIIMNYSGKIQRIALAKNANGEFEDFPLDAELDTFDLSDRKFASAARKASVPVLNATDTDWIDHVVVLRRNGIAVEFICGCDPETWFADS